MDVDVCCGWVVGVGWWVLGFWWVGFWVDFVGLVDWVGFC